MKQSLIGKKDIIENAFNQKDNTSYYYQATDISTIQSQIMSKYSDRFRIHEPIRDSASAKPIISSLKENKPTICIYNLGNWHWVVFAAIKTNDQITILYKDSKGATNSKFEYQLMELIGGDKLTFIDNTEKEQTTGVDCGPFALANVRIMAQELSKNKEKFIDNFEDFEGFCSLKNADSLRRGEFAEKYFAGIYQSIANKSVKTNKLQITDEISKKIKSDNSQAIKLYKQKNYKGAIENYDKALGLITQYSSVVNVSECSAILFNKARAYNQLTQNKLARNLYIDILAVDFNHSKAKTSIQEYNNYKQLGEKVLKAFDLRDVDKERDKIFSAEEEASSKVVLLKLLEEAIYKPLVKSLAYEKNKEKLKNLADLMEGLAILQKNLGNLTGKLNNYTNAAIFYQYLLAIISKKAEQNTEKVKKLFQELSLIRESIILKSGELPKEKISVKEEINLNKEEISLLRTQAEAQVQKIKCFEKGSIEEAKEFFSNISTSLQKFLSRLYEESEKEIGPPPCKYSVMGLGSMALQQMTPYSDLEFIIITENENYKKNKNPKIQKYFDNISHLVHFKIINLGETIIPTSKYGIDLSHLVHKGINFDLGGKTPLGRIENDKPYKLIQTVKKMLKYLYNYGDKSSHIDKNLPYILEKVCYIYGSKELVTQYQKKVTKFLLSKSDNGKLNCEIRALKILQEGSVEINYLSSTSKYKTTEIAGDIEKLRPKLPENAGKLFDVKQEIYRIPDRLLYNIGLYYGLQGNGAWNTVDLLLKASIIGEKAAVHLKHAITFALILRVKTYLNNQCQNENMSVFSDENLNKELLEGQIEKIFFLPKTILSATGELFKYFYIALPLHKKIQEFCAYNKAGKEIKTRKFFQEDSFYEDTNINRGIIHYRLLQYTEAEANLTEALKEPENKFDVKIRTLLAFIYNKFGKVDKAVAELEYCLGSLRNGIDNEVIAAYNYNLAEANRIKGDYSKALKYAQESLKTYEIIYSQKPALDVAVNIANVINVQGSIYFDQGKYKEALELFSTSFAKRGNIYKEMPHADICNSLNSLGEVHRVMGEYEKSLNYHERHKNMQEILHKGQPNPEFAKAINNLAIAYNNIDNHKKAQELYTQSLKIWDNLYKEKLSPDIIRTYDALGNSYSSSKEYVKAKTYHTKSSKMYIKIYGTKPHPDTAMSLFNLGIDYISLVNFEMAKKFCTASLNMRKILYPSGMHPEIAITLYSLAFVHKNQGDHKKALLFYGQAKEIINIFPDSNHKNIINGGLPQITECDDLHSQKQQESEELESLKSLYPLEIIGEYIG